MDSGQFDRLVELCEDKSQEINQKFLSTISRIKALLPERYHLLIMDAEEIYYEKSGRVIEISAAIIENKEASA